jgi:hypothetical protein
MLYIAAIISAKISVLIFIHRLTPFRILHTICRLSILVLLLWGLATFLVTAFACQAPNFWAYSSGKCIDFAAFYRATAALDILSDLFLVVMPGYWFSTLRFQGHGRGTVVAVFVVRIVVLVPAALRLKYIDAASFNSGANLTWTIVPFLIYTTLHMNLSIICASIPCVRPFLRQLESGIMDASVRKHRYLETLKAQETLQSGGIMLATLGTWAAKLINVESSSSVGGETHGSTARVNSMADGTVGSEKMIIEERDDPVEFIKGLRPDFTDYEGVVTSAHAFTNESRRGRAVESSEEEVLRNNCPNGRMSITKTIEYRVKSEQTLTH